MNTNRLLKLSNPRKFLILFFIVLVIVSLLLNYSINQEPPTPGNMLFSAVGKVGRKLEKKYNMPFFGVGGGAKPDGIWLMSLSLKRVSRDPLDEEEARKLIIQCVDDFLKAVNDDEQLRPFLKEYPFTARNIDLCIYSYDENRDLYQFPFISIVADIKGKIAYLSEHPSTPAGYHRKKYETYEEALEILKKQKESLHNHLP